ncbi:hypothetical protein [Streptococcus pluranimalium]|uniref:hypothetical protein n=1 Tax=Streptococcus pluranimalium TaxID=82348 RepID=UPI003F68CAE9
MKLLKLCGLIMVAILLSIVIQIPTYLGVTLFNENIILKITIGIIAFLLIFGGLSLIRVKSFSNRPVNENASLRIIFGWTMSIFLLIIGIKLMLQFLGIPVTSAKNDDLIQQLREKATLFCTIFIKCFC